MCIAILNTGERVTKAAMAESWDTNNDGAGIGYIKKGKLVIEKFPSGGYGGVYSYYTGDPAYSSESFKKMWKRYKKVYKKHGDNPIFLHFRISTSGFSDEMLHPFAIGEGTIMMHNGVIPDLGNNTVSDTKELCDILERNPNPFEAVQDPEIEAHLEDMIGYSKLVFMNNKGDWHIINPQMGDWEADGNWYSNNSWKPTSYWRSGKSSSEKKSTAPTTTTGNGTSCSVGSSYSKSSQRSIAEMTWQEQQEYYDGIAGFGAQEEGNIFDARKLFDDNCLGCEFKSAMTSPECYDCCVLSGDTNDPYKNQSVINAYADTYEEEEKENKSKSYADPIANVSCPDCAAISLYDIDEEKHFCSHCGEYFVEKAPF